MKEGGHMARKEQYRCLVMGTLFGLTCAVFLLPSWAPHNRFLGRRLAGAYHS